MAKESKTDKQAVFAYLDSIEAKGEPIPGVRALRSHFGVGSFATFTDILNQWKIEQEKKRQSRLDNLSIRSVDLEGKLLAAILPILNDRVKEIINEALSETDQPLAIEKQANKDLYVELQELNKENQLLKEELQKAAQEREKISTVVADKLEAMVQKHAQEIQRLKDHYESELRAKDEINRKLDELLSKINPPKVVPEDKKTQDSTGIKRK